MNKWKPRCILQESRMAKSSLAGATDIIPSGTTTNDLVESKLRAQVHCTCHEACVNHFSVMLLAVMAAINNVHRQHVSEDAKPCGSKKLRG